MCTIYKLYSLYTWVLNIYNSTKENGRVELSSSYNSTSRSLNFNSEFLFRIQVFCNRRRYYSSEIKNLFFISTSRLSRLSNPTYYFPVTIKYKFKSKASRITSVRRKAGEKWDRQRKENTQACGVVTKNRLPRQDSVFVLFWNKQNSHRSTRKTRHQIILKQTFYNMEEGRA